jgi:hypothetical protein
MGVIPLFFKGGLNCYRSIKSNMAEAFDMTLVNKTDDVPIEQASEADIKRRNNEKCLRYYYKHRVELQEKRRQKLMEDPEYVAKQEAKRVAKEEKERKRAEREAAKLAKAEREAQAKAEREERRRQKAARVGLTV